MSSRKEIPCWAIVPSFLALILAGCALQPARTEQELQPWSPDGAEVLFMSNREGNAEIYLLKPGSQEWVNLSRNPASDNWAVWSPDGSRIAFQSGRDGKLDIWVMRADGSDQRRLTDHPDHDYIPAWTPDGNRIVFTSWRTESEAEERNPHLYVMNADGSGQRRLVAESLNTSSGANFSPDGSLMVFSRKVEGQPSDLFLTDADGHNPRRLTDDGRTNSTATFSPDGSLIAFYSDDEETSNIEVIRPDGSGRRVIVEGGKHWYPQWSPDGAWLLYTTATDPENLDDLDLYLAPLDASSPPRPLIQAPGREAEGRWKPSQD